MNTEVRSILQIIFPPVTSCCNFLKPKVNLKKSKALKWKMKKGDKKKKRWFEQLKTWSERYGMIIGSQNLKKKRVLSMRPYRKEETNLLLACSLFPGRDWKQFFQEKKRKAAEWKHKNNKTYFNHTSDCQLPVEPGICVKKKKTLSSASHLLCGQTVMPQGKSHDRKIKRDISWVPFERFTSL